MVACLWQANPDKRNTELMTAIQMSGSQANEPDNYLGFGIPDYLFANNLLTVVDKNKKPDISIGIFPNPFAEVINIRIDNLFKGTVIHYIISDITGKVLLQGESGNEANDLQIVTASRLSKGFYFLTVTLGEVQETLKIVKE
jgi:hypothetical protein